MSDDFAIKGEVIDVLESLEKSVDGFTLGMVDKVNVEAGAVVIDVMFAQDTPPSARHTIEDAIYDTLEGLESVQDVVVEPHTQGGPQAVPQTPFAPPAQSSGPAPPKRGMRLAGPGADSSPSPAADKGPSQPSPNMGRGAPSGKVPPQKTIEGVGQVIAVASGKGGVGKSTVACNLALALKHAGFKVGLLDIDIYGPSLPTLLGIKERPAVRDRQIVPVDAAGLKLMSLGFLMDEDTPVIWRGPIVTGIIRQFLQDVDWTGTDYLIIDMPPGTGDAQLSLAQTVPVDGAIVVTTPSDLALIDAARGLQMFRTLNVDVLGIVENMSHFVWPGLADARDATAALRETLGDNADASEPLAKLEGVLEEHARTYIFGRGGGKREAERLDLPLLGEIPLDMRVRSGGDAGKPIMLDDPEAPASQAFIALAEKLNALKPVEGGGKKKKGVFSFIRS